MHFTLDDYRKIEEWLRTRTIKDTQFPVADPLTGKEQVPIIQDDINKTVNLSSFIRQLSLMELPDFFNVTNFIKEGCLTLEEAINAVPVEQRKLGLVITFYTEKGNWIIYQFKGTSLNQWGSMSCWRSLVEETLEELVFFPDEEDITSVRRDNKTVLKFKDKDINPAEFSNTGIITLRRNSTGTEACSIDDEDHVINELFQKAINQPNTIYIIKYDFDLNGKALTIPENSILWFQGGSLNNGSIYLQDTAILGAFEFADMGNVKLYGSFNTGQVMTFSNDSYKAKEGNYFVDTTKPSSATSQEDIKNDNETFYDVNSNAYITRVRQELRWWNGKEWLQVLDITDYNEIKSIINDLINKHNLEMSACYRYFKTRCYAIETRVDNTESRLDAHDATLNNHTERLNDHDSRLSEHDTRLNNHDNTLSNHESRIGTAESNINSINRDINSINNSITNIRGDIGTINGTITSINSSIGDINNKYTTIQDSVNNLANTINNLNQTIDNRVAQYLQDNVVGTESITVNGSKITPDSNGNITLPDYPSLPDIDITPYDDTELKNRCTTLEQKCATLEQKCTSLETELANLKTQLVTLTAMPEIVTVNMAADQASTEIEVTATDINGNAKNITKDDLEIISDPDITIA